MKDHKNREFLKTIAKLTLGLDVQKRSSFLLKWADALESYGTPRDFVYSITCKNLDVNIDGKLYSYVYIKSENYDQRKLFMSNQKKYLPQQNISDYNIKNIDFSDCFLCKNVVQAIDAAKTHNAENNNAILNLSKYLLAPNRYPNIAGHSLFMTIDHDDMTNRVKGYRDEKEKSAVYPFESGKTRGNILEEGFLESLLNTCDTLELVGIRNHPLNGMSIPGHDHFHIFPDDVLIYNNSSRLKARKEKSNYGCNIFVSSDHPFDTLIISKEKDTDKSMIETAIPLLENLEKDNQVATLLYYKDCLFVSVLNTAKEWIKPLAVATAVIPAEFINNANPEYLSGLKDTQALKGTVNWKKYLL